MRLELTHKQQDNMGSNISNVVTNKETLKEVVEQITKGNEWGDIYICKGIGCSFFNRAEGHISYSKGNVIENTFPNSEMEKMVVGGKCWHSWGRADYYFKVRKPQKARGEE